MPQIPAQWALKVYSKLWLKFGDKSFSNDEAQKIVKNIKNKLNQALSRLKRDGWLHITLNEQDARKSLYVLRKPDEVIKEIVEEYAKTN